MNMGMYTGKAKSYLGDNMAFLSGSPKVYNGWEADEVNSRHDAYPVIKDGITYLPLRYIAETLGGQVSYNDETAEITVTYINPVVIKPGEYFTINGSSLIRAEKAEELFDIEVSTYSNGLIVMGTDIRITENDQNVINELARRVSNE